MKLFLIEAWHAVSQFLGPLIPGALGAAVAQAWEKGTSWQQRLIQWCVVVLVAAYLAPALGHREFDVIGVVGSRAQPEAL